MLVSVRISFEEDVAGWKDERIEADEWTVRGVSLAKQQLYSLFNKRICRLLSDDTDLHVVLGVGICFATFAS